MRVEDDEIQDETEQEEILDVEEIPAEIVKEATEMGWQPREKFKGDLKNWIPADEFVEKGRHVLPIVLKDRERLRRELLTRDQKIDNLKTSLESAQAAIKALQETQSQATKRAVDAAIADVKKKIVEAREDGDVDTELALVDKLQDLKAAKKDPVASATEAKPEDKKDELSKEFLSWKANNDWFDGKSPEDKKRTKQAVRLAEDIKEENPDLTGQEFFDKLDEALAQLEKPATRSASKVESGGGRGGSSVRKGYADLPSDARKACDDFADDLVGEGKQYKTLADWRASYAKTYFGGE